MSIYIHKNNQQLGPFEEMAVLAWLKNGQLSGEDFGCPTGTKEWQKLKTLFANPVQSSAASIAVPLASNGGGQAVSNQPIVNWARQVLQNPVKVKGLFNSRIIMVFGYAIFALFLGLSFLTLISGLDKLITEGWNKSFKEGMIISTVLLVGFGGMFLIIVLIRRNIATVLSSKGVKTRSRKNYLWENLCFLNYKTMSYKGNKKTAVEMIFANGKAVIPPHTSNKSEILRLLDTMPVQRRDNGRIR